MALNQHTITSLRPLLPDDAPTAADVIYRATSAAYTFMSWTHGRQDTRNWFQSKLNDWSQVWVAERAGRVVGVVCLYDDYIDELFVDTDQQRQGIGSRLLAKAIQHCDGPVTLHTFQKNAAARVFYEKHGFEAVAFGISEEEGEPDVFYRFVPSNEADPALR